MPSTSPSPSTSESRHSVGNVPDTRLSKSSDHVHDYDLGPIQMRRVSSSSREYAPPSRTPSLSPQTKIINQPTEDTISANQKPVTAQPAKTQDPSVKEAVPPPDFIADLHSRHRSNVLQRFLFNLNHGCNSTIYNILLALFVVLFYWLSTGLFSLFIGCLSLAIFFGLPAAYGTIALVIGNTILRATDHAHYTSNASAAAIGAVGAIPAYISYLALYRITYITFQIRTQIHESTLFTWPAASVLMMFAGGLGVSLLKHNQIDIGDIDVLHGVAAGAVGGALLGPVTILAGAAISLTVGVLLTPLWVTMLLGFRWAYGHSSESWRGNTYRSSSCYTYGSCGDDPDIEAETGYTGRGCGLSYESLRECYY